MGRYSGGCTTDAMLSRLEAWEQTGRLPGKVSEEWRLGVTPDGRLTRWSYSNPFIHN